MAILTLTPRERAELERLARTTHDAAQLRRANALLALADGQGPRPSPAPSGSVARRSTGGSPASTSTAAGTSMPPRPPAPGRSRELRDQVVARVGELMGRTPGDFGYRHTNWTTELLVEQLGREGTEASDSTVRRSLHEAGYRWKRPRFVLSRRSPTWRQAKGGSGGGSRAGSGRRSSSPTPRS